MNLGSGTHTHHGDRPLVRELREHLGHGARAVREAGVFEHPHGSVPHHRAVPRQPPAERLERALPDVHTCARAVSERANLLHILLLGAYAVRLSNGSDLKESTRMT